MLVPARQAECGRLCRHAVEPVPPTTHPLQHTKLSRGHRDRNMRNTCVDQVTWGETWERRVD